MTLIKPILTAMAQRDVLATVGISAGSLAFVRVAQLEAFAQAVILGGTALFVMVRAVLEARKLVLTVRADNAARRNRRRLRNAKRQREKGQREKK